MIELLDQWDKALFVWLNGFHSPFWDVVMYWVSTKVFWVPFYLFLLGWIWYKKGWKTCLTILGAIGILILLSDQSTSGILKPTVERYRPCHPQAGIEAQVHTVYGHCGGKYGFASSHAANFFTMATFLSLFFRRRMTTFIFLGIAALVAYSRIYLGVHYPGDVIAGGLIGACWALLIWKLSVRYLHDHVLPDS